jgi:acyl-CoA thioester hydrolase
MSDPVFRCQHRVSYAECTMGNHIYYSRYLDVLERARGDFFRHSGKTFLEWQNEGTIFPVLECRLKYHAPARYDDLLTIEVRVTLAKGVRLNFAHRILGPDSRLLVEAETFHVCASVEEKPKRLPGELVDRLSRAGGASALASRFGQSPD